MMKIILCVFTLIVIANGAKKASKCEMLSRLLEDMAKEYQSMIPKTSPGLGNTFMNLRIGYNLSNLADVKKLGCRLSTVRTVQQLALALEAPFDNVRQFYQERVANVIARGGTLKISKQMTIVMKIIDAIKKFKFPEFPLQKSKLLRSFFLKMATRYGQYFLDTLETGYRLRVSDPVVVAEAFARAQNLNDVATGLGVDPAVIPHIDRIRNFTDNLIRSRRVLKAGQKVVDKFDQLGLFTLA